MNDTIKKINDEIEWCKGMLSYASGDRYLEYKQKIKELKKRLRNLKKMQDDVEREF